MDVGVGGVAGLENVERCELRAVPEEERRVMYHLCVSVKVRRRRESGSSLCLESC